MIRKTLTGLPVAAALGAALVLAGDARAGDVTIVDARAQAEAGGGYTFHVTLEHADEGWEHYADRWEVLSPDGEVIGTRVLLHPHENEQPFTRSLSGVQVPQGIERVTIRAHDLVHGDGPETVEIALPDRG